ncbi:MAG: uroporphyrinogen decarboxylase family protein [Rhodospirillales bacterium]|jgi:hypothetical protein|nr:hypothetical protein [Rhodospirillaceae bacterium]MDP6430162.1 uroporphyrinogen decarboxylase family protein [Rhodospirillales bacterium]MDP6643525.1 uroporphyrinogen decarboxylase family protein [Rhodospirillales bacterium]MDP6840809.1 uroporphyrinogen decarboxylase family protein [Rhodospirillales bacterium]|tara:strand:+ start:778 stop:2025 length:1248 start_codon:yes stop_codon:yes gene_type:complete
MLDRPANELFAERKQRHLDAAAMRETDRVPFVFFSHFWPAKLAGISFEEAMHDLDKLEDAYMQALRLLQPDGYAAMQMIVGTGRTLEALDYKQVKWPGHGTGANTTFQYLDREYMSADEYDDYLFDPTGFYLHKFLPRISGAFECFGRFPDFPTGVAWTVIHSLAAFAEPELEEGFNDVVRAGKELNTLIGRTVEFVDKMNAEGIPLASAGRCQAPFDIFADYLRGSKGAMLDMFRNKDKLLAAMEKAHVLLLRNVAAAPKAFDCPFVFIPLHWGLDGFMSPEQFKTFYWPQLRGIILALIEMDLIPVVLWEGDCTTRLELIGDIPKGKAVYWFEKTDLVLAKEVLGDVVCVRGSVPPSLLITGTPDDVDAYCGNLIKKAGKGGGFVLDGSIGIPDEAKVENVVAMAQSVHKYAI